MAELTHVLTTSNEREPHPQAGCTCFLWGHNETERVVREDAPPEDAFSRSLPSDDANHISAAYSDTLWLCATVAFLQVVAVQPVVAASPATEASRACKAVSH